MKKLERSLSLTSVIAISIGGMLGSGIFVLPGLAAAKTGPSVWIAYLIAALCILPAALSKSELATAMPSSGGTYIYIERAFGPIYGTIAGIGLWLSLLLKSSFALVGFGAYMSVLVNIPEGMTKYISIFFLGIILVLNVFGVKKVGKVQIIIVAISLLTLLSILFLGLPQVEMTNFDPFYTNGRGGLLTTVAFVYISYAGVTKVAAIAGEIKNPSKNLPLSMILSLVIMTTIYVSIAFVLVGNLPLTDLSVDIKPIYTISNVLGGRYFSIIVAVVGVITLISMANSGVLASSRFPFAMAMDKLLPSFMGKIHPKYLTPIVTILITGISMAVVILFVDVVKIAKLASAFMVMMFISVNACVIVLRETSAQWYVPTYKSPMYPFVQIFGIISGVVLLVFLGLTPLLSIITIVVLGFAIYYLHGRKTARIGILRKYGHRPALFLLYDRKNSEKRGQKIKAAQDNFLDGKISDGAGAVVPLLGNENSPEMLVEIGAALNNKESTQAVNITEVPNQTFLDAVMEDGPQITSLSRRLSVMANSKRMSVDFEAMVTHDIPYTIYELSAQTSCSWLVMGWDGRAHNGILVNNPLGWLIRHVDSNFALFKDNGVRYISKVLLPLRPGGKNSERFISAVNRICEFYNASFTLLHVVPEQTSDEEIEEMKVRGEKLLSAATVNATMKIKKSDNPIEKVSSYSAEYDLLVIGTPVVDNWRNVLFGNGKDKFADSSACSVLRLTLKQ